MAATALPSALSSRDATPAAAKVPGSRHAKAWKQAQDLEAVFLNTMMGQMIGTASDNGPMGGKTNEAWRSMLVDEHAKNFAQKGGIGLAPQIYRELVGAQEAAPRRLPAVAAPAASAAYSATGAAP